MITIETLTERTRAVFGPALQKLESLAEYPLGDDHFRIDHGPSYFGFFDRLGPSVIKIAREGDEVVACAVGVLRHVGPTRCWYLCDLKVHPRYRGRGLPARMFRQNLLKHYLKCGRAYAVSMNPADRPNPVVKLLERLPWAPLRNAGELHIFSMDFDQVTALRPRLTEALGRISFLSLREKKDLVLRSTGHPLALLHVQHGPFAAPDLDQPEPGATHMICARPGTHLHELLGASLRPGATATLLTHRLSAERCSFILTSDI